MVPVGLSNLPPMPAENSSSQTNSVISTLPSTNQSAAPEVGDLQNKLNETLKNTGFMAEVDTSNPAQVVVRIVDGVTGRTVVQIPSTTAIAIAQAIRKGQLEDGQVDTGTLFDEAA